MLLFMTASNHVIELIAPWLVLLPWRPAQAAFGATHVVFQLSLILTGNLSFLNWLTIIPGLWSFDDAMLVGLLPTKMAESVAAAVVKAEAESFSPSIFSMASFTGILRNILAFIVLVWLSVPVCGNLLGPRVGERQRMNSSFERIITLPQWMLRPLGLDMSTAVSDTDEKAVKRRRFDSYQGGLTFDCRALRLLNTYGAFGSVNRERIEIVFLGRCEGDEVWLPYTFKAAVDDPMKRPRWLAPYHLRLDWCRWIASCRGRRASGMEEKWVLSFVSKLLLGDPGVRRLLARAGDPFAEGSPPKYVRADLRLYHFAQPPQTEDEPYWTCEVVGQYLPPLSLRDLAPQLLDWGFVRSTTS